MSRLHFMVLSSFDETDCSLCLFTDICFVAVAPALSQRKHSRCKRYSSAGQLQ